MTSWRTMITEEMAKHGETWNDVVACTLTEKELDRQFDDDYGAAKGKWFTLWTTHRVYFPAVYDGLEWCDSVSRNPDGKPTGHVGG